jgi:flagellar basal-body rod protein FlgF
MIKGIYTSASGMLPRILKQEVAANNIANVNSTGYKKDSVFMQVLDDATKDNITKDAPWETPMVDDLYTDFTQGPVERTDNDRDFAIEGNGFFAVDTDKGIRYTRSGNFSISSQGIVTDALGNPVQSDSGPIAVATGDLTIGTDGSISAAGTSLGKLQIADFDTPYKLKKVENGYYAPADDTITPKQAVNYQIRQGYLEKSNVNVVETMVDMLTSFRAYEAGQKAIQSQDETLEKAVTELGRLS